MLPTVDLAVSSATPYQLSIGDAQLKELKDRLVRTRWPDEPDAQPWSTGVDSTWMRRVAQHWSTTFDWATQQSKLNAFPQFTADIGGSRIHWIEVRGKGPNPIPLLIMHGWPGSIFEFLDIIPRLTDPAAYGGDAKDAFTVIAPSLPGFGLSHTPGKRFSAEQMADTLDALMTRILGFERYAAQGGDWGATVGARMAYAFPEHLIGLHLNRMPTPRRLDGIAEPTDEERKYLRQLAHWQREEAGYALQQGTRPQTLAYAMNDSPVGLAAWILDKFRAWSDCEGDLESTFSLDTLLANVSLYWFTGSAGSSFWPYYARAHAAHWPVPEGEKVHVPTGYAEFPAEVYHAPRSVAERMFTDIRRWTAMKRGGHFAALEQPQALADDIQAFFRPWRSVGSSRH